MGKCHILLVYSLSVSITGTHWFI